MKNKEKKLKDEKVRSLLDTEVNLKTVQNKYDEIYRCEEVWYRRTYIGNSSLIIHLLKDELHGKTVLEAGCGAGKLALMMSKVAKWVDGIDFSGQAIRIAQLLKTLSRTENVSFKKQSLEELPEDPKYDVVTLIGTLEHVMDPIETLCKLYGVMKPGGVLVVECPGFFNFRGDIYMTLSTLMGLPMSLADIRQVDYQDIREWADQGALKLETVCGYAYALGWLKKGVEDMVRRTTFAIRDKGIENIDWNIKRLHWWMDKRFSSNKLFLEKLEKEGVLQRIPVGPRIEIDRSAWVDEPPSDVPMRIWKAFDAYLDDNSYDDPYYSVVPPYCYFGGGVIYFLRK